MAVTMSLYDHTVKLIVNKEVDYTTLKVKLLDNTASFSASQTTVASVDGSGAKEVSGNGWTSGGITLTSVAVTIATTNDAMLDADDVAVTASGGLHRSSLCCAGLRLHQQQAARLYRLRAGAIGGCHDRLQDRLGRHGHHQVLVLIETEGDQR